MPQISKLSVILTGSIAGFSASMAQGSRELAGFQASFKSAAGSISAIGATLGAGAAVGGIVELTRHSFENIAATARLSDTLGIATQSLSQMDYAAKVTGVSVEGLHGALFKMEKALGGADEEGGKSAEAFAALGLSVADLAKLPADQALGKIADALNGVGNASDRNALAAKIFGKGVAEVVPLLALGSAGIAKLSGEADKLGASFNRVDAAKVQAANASLARVGAVLEGAFNKLVIELAPFLEALANKLAEIATRGRGLGGTLVAAFESIVKGIAAAADYLELARAGFYVLETAGLIAFAELERAIGFVLKALDYLQSKLPGHTRQGWGDAYASEAKKLEQSAVKAFEAAGESFDKFAAGESSHKVGALFASIRFEAQKAAQAVADAKQNVGGLADAVGAESEKAAEKVAELQKQFEQLGMTDAEKAADDVRRIGGSVQQILDAGYFQELIDQFKEAQKAQQQMAEEGKRLWEETRTPLEQYNAELQKNQKLLRAGAIDKDTYDRAAAKAREALDKSQEKGQGKSFEPARLLTAGSGEAAEFIARIQGTRGADAQQQQMLKRQDQANVYLKQIADASTGGVGLSVASFN